MLIKGFLAGIGERMKQWVNYVVGKPKFDGFTVANGDEIILKMDVAAGRCRGAWRAVRGFEVKGWAGRISFSFVGGCTTSWHDVGRVTGLECIISSHLISSHLVSSRLVSFHLISSSLAHWETNQSNSSMTSAHKVPDSVGVHGRVGVCRSEFRACCVLCVCFVHPVPSAAYFVASFFSSLLPGFLQDHRNLGKRPACKKQPKMEV